MDRTDRASHSEARARQRFKFRQTRRTAQRAYEDAQANGRIAGATARRVLEDAQGNGNGPFRSVASFSTQAARVHASYSFARAGSSTWLGEWAGEELVLQFDREQRIVQNRAMRPSPLQILEFGSASGLTVSPAVTSKVLPMVRRDPVNATYVP